MKKRSKKGFTLVELLVVIGILAVLAVVSVVGYFGFIKKANISNDVSLTTQLNTILQANETTDGKNKYPQEAVEELVDGGFDVTKFTPTTSGYNYVYDLSQNRVFLLDESYTVVAPSDLTLTTDKASVFGFASSQEEVTKFNNAGYSVYLKNTYASDSVNTTKGVDVGSVENVNVSLTSTPVVKGSVKPTIYRALGASQTSYVVRTNGGTLTINNSEAVVSHYGSSTKVEIEAVATHSEYGEVEGSIEIKEGELNLESSSNVNTVLITCENSTDVSINVATQATVGTVAPITEAAQTTINQSTSIPTESKVTGIQKPEKTSLFSGGIGSEKSPYIISSVDEFDNINAEAIKGDNCYFKLVSDIDLTKYTPDSDGWPSKIYLLENDTLDLNNYTISSNNSSVAYDGHNMTIKNGKFVAVNTGSYAIFIGNETYNKTNEVITAKNIVVENITCEGGINVCDAEVTIKNVYAESKVSGTNYYAVWGESYAKVTIESGTFTSASYVGKAVLAASKKSNGTIIIKGGTFVGDSNVKIIQDAPYNSITLQGGTYNLNPNGKLGEGYYLYSNGISSFVVAQTCPSGYTEVDATN